MPLEIIDLDLEDHETEVRKLIEKYMSWNMEMTKSEYNINLNEFGYPDLDKFVKAQIEVPPPNLDSFCLLQHVSSLLGFIMKSLEWEG